MSVQKLYRHTVARHGRMILFANDTGAVTSALMRYGEWAEREIAFMASLAGEGATVLDVGAYIGTHTLAFSRLVGARGRVIAFEPQPASFRVLERNVAFNKISNVELHEAAAGETSSETAFRPTDPRATSSFGSAVMQDWISEVPSLDADLPRVAVIAIDRVDLDRCDLIKIDVEGMEGAVIAGARETIRRHQPWIYAECNSVEGGLETWRLLASLGYDVRLHLVQAFNPDNLRGETVNVFDEACEAGIVGVPPGRSWTLGGLAMGHGEMLLRIETADDLVLGMLNKPQYEVEVLRESAAAASGGDRWFGSRRDVSETAEVARDAAFAQTQEALEQVQALALERAGEIDHISAQLARTQESHERIQTLALERAGEIDRIAAQLARTQEAHELGQTLALERAGEIDRIAARAARTQEALEDIQALAIDRFKEIGTLHHMVEATLRQADIARSLQRKAAAEAAAEGDRLAAALRDAQTAFERSQEQLQATQEQASNSRVESQRLAAALRDAQTAFERSQEQLQATQEQASNSRDESQRLASVLSDRQAEYDREKGRIDSLLASTSWRITKPMRALSRAVLRR